MRLDAAGHRRAVHPDRAEPEGLPLDVGRSLHLVPLHLRRAAEVRDGGCVFAGWGAPTWFCDPGKPRRHHTKVHHGARVERRPDGRWSTWRPDGTEICTGPHRTGPPLTAAA